jgi:hypothetical protein
MDSGAAEDLALTDDDADKVVVGVKKKKGATSQVGPYKTSPGGAGDPSKESYMDGSPEMGG